MKIGYKNLCAGVLITVASSVAQDNSAQIKPVPAATESTVKSIQHKHPASDYISYVRIYENNVSTSTTATKDSKPAFVSHRQTRKFARVYHARSGLFDEEGDEAG